MLELLTFVKNVGVGFYKADIIHSFIVTFYPILALLRKFILIISLLVYFSKT